MTAETAGTVVTEETDAIAGTDVTAESAMTVEIATTTNRLITNRSEHLRTRKNNFRVFSFL